MAVTDFDPFSVDTIENPYPFYEALPEGGALVIYEALIDDDRRDNAFGLLMSLNMLIETYDGFDYTGADCQGWLAEAGFRESRVEHLLGPDSMVVGIK